MAGTPSPPALAREASPTGPATSVEGTSNVEHLALGKKTADSVDDAVLLPDHARPKPRGVARRHALDAVDRHGLRVHQPADDGDGQRARRLSDGADLRGELWRDARLRDQEVIQLLQG